jgi:hypothetical protein
MESASRVFFRFNVRFAIANPVDVESHTGKENQRGLDRQSWRRRYGRADLLRSVRAPASGAALPGRAPWDVKTLRRRCLLFDLFVLQRAAARDATDARVRRVGLGRPHTVSVCAWLRAAVRVACTET